MKRSKPLLYADGTSPEAWDEYSTARDDKRPLATRLTAYASACWLRRYLSVPQRDHLPSIARDLAALVGKAGPGGVRAAGVQWKVDTSGNLVCSLPMDDPYISTC